MRLRPNLMRIKYILAVYVKIIGPFRISVQEKTYLKTVDNILMFIMCIMKLSCFNNNLDFFGLNLRRGHV